MALPKLSTGALNIYADPLLGSEISPTTSPAASSKQEDSDPNYTLNYEEPVNLLAILAVIAGILIGLIGLMVLCLATWMHSPGYNVGMVSLYAAWVVILWGAAAVLLECVSKAEQIYNQDAQSQTLK